MIFGKDTLDDLDACKSALEACKPAALEPQDVLRTAQEKLERAVDAVIAAATPAGSCSDSTSSRESIG